jgi:hypothetical protein
MMSTLLNVMLLAVGWLLLMVGGFIERRESPVRIDRRWLPGSFRGRKVHCSIKTEYMHSIGNENTLPCSIAGKDL